MTYSMPYCSHYIHLLNWNLPELYYISCIFYVAFWFQLMDNGDVSAVGLHVHKLVVVAYALDNESVTILHPPMVVWIV